MTKQKKRFYYLIVAATMMEVPALVEPQEKHFSTGVFRLWEDTALLITGVGQYNSLLQIMHFIQQYGHPEEIVNVGICGSYNSLYSPETLVQVISDEPAGQIVASGNQWKRWHEAGLPEKTAGAVCPPIPDWVHALKLPSVKGITTDFLTENQATIDQRKSFFKADVESMEGAAVFFIARHLNIKAAQIRCVSNFAGDRDKKNWKFDEAIEQLNKFVLEKLKPLLSR